MDSRQRLLTVLEGGIPDRVPVVAWFDPAFLQGYLDRTDFDPLAETIRVSKALGFDTILRVYLAEVTTWEADHWRLTTRIRDLGSVQRRVKTIETPEGELREAVIVKEAQPGRFFRHTEEHLISTEDDLRLMERYRVVRPPVDTTPLERALELIGDDGIVVAYGGGAAHTGAALYLRGLERLTMDAIKRPGLYQRLLTWAIAYETPLLDALERFRPDLCQIGGLMAQGNFVGPDFYRGNVLSYDRRYIEKVHERGLRTVYHNCGYSNNLLHLYTELGSDAFETFPPPPTADGDMATVKRVLGDSAVILGNIDQVHLLREGTTEQIARVVKETVLTGKAGGGYILMTGDELYHDTPVDSLRTMAEVGRAFGSYS
jgi:hypothetical protein